jgi:methanogenic corrinoid protein MtbC1
VLVGGRPFTEQPDLGEAIGADLVASDAGAAVDLLRSRFP